MSRPSTAEFARLNALVFEVCEIFAADGHHIAQALSVDDAFRAGEDPRSTLARALMKKAVGSAAGKLYLEVQTTSGGGRNVVSLDGNTYRRYRVRRAKEQPDGSFLIEANGDAILQTEGDSFFWEEVWVLAYTLTDDNQLDVVFVAEVLDVVEGYPGHLVLGEVHRIEGDPPTPPARFTPTDEGLEGFDDEEGEATELG